MSSSTWRVLSGYATYQRTPIRMTSLGKCAPLKLIAIVVLPQDRPLVMEGDHTAHGLKGKLATKPLRDVSVVECDGVGRKVTRLYSRALCYHFYGMDGHSTARRGLAALSHPRRNGMIKLVTRERMW